MMQQVRTTANSTASAIIAVLFSLERSVRITQSSELRSIIHRLLEKCEYAENRA